MDDQAAIRSWLSSALPHSCGVGSIEITQSLRELPALEEAAIQASGETRKREFAAGRSAARMALRKLGYEHAIIPVAKDRSPIWPQDVVGSISHSSSSAVAVVGMRKDVIGIGVDIESAQSLEPNLWREVLLPAEIAFLGSLHEAERDQYATVLYSIKETFYKFQYPQTHKWIDFHEVRVIPNLSSKEWDLISTRPIPVGSGLSTRFHGKYHVDSQFVLSVMFFARDL